MKKIFLPLLMIALAAGALQAQKPGKMKMKHQQGMMAQKLNLTEDQKAKFKSINEDFRKQMQDLKKKDDITVKEWKTRKENLMKDHIEKMQSVLTADQKTEIRKMKDDRQSKMKERNEKRFDRMKQKLSLTA